MCGFFIHAEQRSDWSTSDWLSCNFNAWHNFPAKYTKQTCLLELFVFICEFFWGKNLRVNHLSVFFFTQHHKLVVNLWLFGEIVIIFKISRWYHFCELTFTASACISLYHFRCSCILVENTFERKLQTVYYWICWVRSLHWILMRFPFISSEFEIKLFFGVKWVSGGAFYEMYSV